MSYSDPYDHRGPYRSRHGIVFGVCQGIADYFHFSVFWTRIIVLIAFLCTGFWPAGVLYIVAALLMKKEPVYAWVSTCGDWVHRSCQSTGAHLHHRFRHAFDSLDERIRRMENPVTSRERNWDERLRTGGR